MTTYQPLSETTMELWNKAHFITQVQFIRALNKLISPRQDQDKARLSKIETMCKEMLANFGEFDTEEEELEAKKNQPQEVQIVTELPKVKKDSWEAYKDWHLDKFKFPPQEFEKMNPIQKNNYVTWKSGYEFN